MLSNGMMSASRRKSYAVGILLVNCLFASGCGSKDGESVHFHGKVMFRGTAVPAGRIDFLPDKQKGNLGKGGFALIEHGEFNTKQNGRGVPPGDYVARIAAYDGKPQQIDEGSEFGAPLFSTQNRPITVSENGQTIDLMLP